MPKNKKAFLIASACFLAFFALVALKNFLANSAFYIVTGDVLDEIDYYLCMPGVFLVALFEIIVSRNIHNSYLYVDLLLTPILNSVFYGWIFSTIIIKWNKHLNGS